MTMLERVARANAIQEAIDAIASKIDEARSFGVDQRELTAMGWCLDTLRELQWGPVHIIEKDTTNEQG